MQVHTRLRVWGAAARLLHRAWLQARHWVGVRVQVRVQLTHDTQMGGRRQALLNQLLPSDPVLQTYKAFERWHMEWWRAGTPKLRKVGTLSMPLLARDLWVSPMLVHAS